MACSPLEALETTIADLLKDSGLARGQLEIVCQSESELKPFIDEIRASGIRPAPEFLRHWALLGIPVRFDLLCPPGDIYIIPVRK